MKSFLRILIFSLCLIGLVSMTHGIVYELRAGKLVEKPGTSANPNPNIYIEDLVKTLLLHQTELEELRNVIRARDKQILELREEMATLRREMNGLKRHYFRQF